jgi:hypothetical protein
MGRGIRLTHEQLNQIDLLWFRTTPTDVFRNCLIFTKSDFGDEKTTDGGRHFRTGKASGTQGETGRFDPERARMAQGYFAAERGRGCRGFSPDDGHPQPAASRSISRC